MNCTSFKSCLVCEFCLLDVVSIKGFVVQSLGREGLVAESLIIKFSLKQYNILDFDNMVKLIKTITVKSVQILYLLFRRSIWTSISMFIILMLSYKITSFTEYHNGN